MAATAPSPGWGRRALVLLVAAAVLALGLLAFWPRSVPVTLVRVARRPLRAGILCSGLLDPPAGGEVRTLEGGFAGAIPVASGSRVRKGDLLLRIDNPDIQAARLGAETELAQVRTSAAAAAADLRKATDDERTKRQTVEADSRLLAHGAIARVAYDADVEALRAASASLDSIRARDASYREGPRSEVAVAQEKAAALAARADALLVRAPSDGVVYGLPRVVGEALPAGSVVARVTDPAAPRVLARVDEPDLPRVSVGETLNVAFDGLPGEFFRGAVETVPKELRDIGNRRVGEIVGILRDPGHRLPLNASVNVEIIVGERASALVLPRSAVRREGDSRYVLVVSNGRAARQDVTTGLVGAQDTEILTGLTEGEGVIASAGTPIAPGRAVRPE